MKSLVHAPVATFTIDIEHRIEFVSDSWKELTGYPVEELLGHGYRVILHPDDRSRVGREMVRRHVNQCGSSYDTRIVTKSGEVKVMRSTTVASFSESGEFQGFTGKLTDITNRVAGKYCPHFLDCVEKRPAAIIPNHHAPTVSFDMDGTLCNTYQALLDILTEQNPVDSYSWQELFCSGNCRRCGTCMCESSGDASLSSRRILAGKRRAHRTPRFWETIEPFDEDDLKLIRDQLQIQLYAAVFVATRRDLDTPDELADARLLSASWLARYEIAGYVGTCFDAPDKARELLLLNVQYHLDDDPRDVARVRELGIEAFLVSRPWNLDADCAYRVDSVAQFLEIVAPMPEIVDHEFEDVAVSAHVAMKFLAPVARINLED
jgi:PAS domain S-box-containing protein